MTTGILLLLPIQPEVNIRRRRSLGVFSCLRVVDLRVQTAVFAVSAKPEVVVSRPEVVLRLRYRAATCISPSVMHLLLLFHHYTVCPRKNGPPKYNGVVFEILGRHH